MDLENFCVCLSGSREPWYVTSRYPSNAYRGNPRPVEYRGNPWSGGVTSFFSHKTGCFSGDLGTSRRRRVIQGHDTSSCCRLQVQGLDTSRRYRLTGARHITSLSPTRVQCPFCGCPSASFTFTDSIRCSSSVRKFFFFLTDSPNSSRAHFDTTPTGAFGRNGSHGESALTDETKLGLLRTHWIFGPSFTGGS